ncbi:baseplate complex protein [Spartinivicinus ruber]|uniref:baseplate complex protein n=1 Tax=Spartinivicinus ruber TaxID=2683272 RepID=UPI0013D04539|nr:DNA-binding protein [Spartinivicinus ruber]
MMIGDYQVQGSNLQVVGGLRISNEELSGASSATDRAHKGFKPKTLTVSLQIKQSQPEQLTRLIELAEGVDKAGKQTVYTLVDNTAKAMNIRQVQFNDNLSARESADKRLWQVQFTLAEYRSVPEKVEQRQPKKDPKKQQADGQPIGSDNQASNEPALTEFEQLLKQIDEQIGPRETEQPADDQSADNTASAA